MMDVHHHADMDHITSEASSHVGVKRKAPDSDTLPSLIGDGQEMHLDDDPEWAAESPNLRPMEAMARDSEVIPTTELNLAPNEGSLDADQGPQNNMSEEQVLQAQEILPPELSGNVDAMRVHNEPSSSPCADANVSIIGIALEELNGPQPDPAILEQQSQEQDQIQPESRSQHPPTASDLGIDPSESNDPVVRALNRLISPSSGGGLSDVKHLPTLETLLEVS